MCLLQYSDMLSWDLSAKLPAGLGYAEEFEFFRKVISSLSSPLFSLLAHVSRVFPLLSILAILYLPRFACSLYEDLNSVLKQSTSSLLLPLLSRSSPPYLPPPPLPIRLFSLYTSNLLFSFIFSFFYYRKGWFARQCRILIRSSTGSVALIWSRS